MTAFRSLLVLGLLVGALAPAWACAQDVSPSAAESPLGWWPPGTPANAAMPERTPCGDRMCPAATTCVVDGCRTADGAIVETEEVDLEHARRSRAHHRLMLGGGLALGIGWLVSVVFSSFAGYDAGFFGTSGGFRSGWDELRFTGYVPLAGPWIQLAMNREGVWSVWPAVMGAVQLVGLGVLVLGIVLEENNGSEPLPIEVAPMLDEGLAGLLVGGTF